MTDRVIAIDYDKCTGCRMCEVACSTTNSGETNPERSRIRVVKIEQEAQTWAIPVVCMKCIKPACKAVCPMGAISDDPVTGARKIDENKCVGCSACVYACPFGAIAVDRSLGCSFTCNLCDGEPACVKFCPREALKYLDNGEVSMKLRRAGLDKYVAFIKSESKQEEVHTS